LAHPWPRLTQASQPDKPLEDLKLLTVKGSSNNSWILYFSEISSKNLSKFLLCSFF